jgi:hypothetical protein
MMKCPVCDKQYKIENRFEDHLYKHGMSDREVMRIMHDARYNNGEPSPLEYEDVYDRLNKGYYANPLAYPDASTYPDKETRMQALKEYREAGHLTDAKFRDDALEACDLKGHPKADKAYSMAWDRGHSSGYHDVLINLKELSDLLI